MVEKSMVSPPIDFDELRLKKELTALGKSRFLRDPETCSSWRSPVSTTRFSATHAPLNHSPGGQARGGFDIGMSISVPAQKDAELLIELDDSSLQPTIPPGREKSIFLYNWRHRSSGKGKWSFSNILGSENGRIHPNRDDLQGSVNGSSIGAGENSLSDSLREDPSDDVRHINESSSMVVRKPGRKLRKNTKTDARNSRSHQHRNEMELQQHGHSDFCKFGDFTDSLYDLARDLSHSQAESPLLHGYLGSEEHIIPKDEKCNCLSKLVRGSRKEESSYTPASTRNPSLIDSWDGTTSCGGIELDDYLDVRGQQGCGIPCYWSKKMKYNKTPQGCCSPSSDSSRRRTRNQGRGRRGNNIPCAGQFTCSKHSPSASASPSLSPSLLRHKCPRASTDPSSGLSLLLTDGRNHGATLSSETLMDELSTDFGEVDLEASSRLDGRKWSCCRSPSEQLGLSLDVEVGARGDAMVPDQETPRSLSQKYRPRSFDELVGLKIVVQSLVNALSRGRIAPMYLFQGFRGTGKTSVARIFAASLNCLSTDKVKPCGFCQKCTDDTTGKSVSTIELDATNGKAIAKVKQLLENASASPQRTNYTVLLIDECHLLSAKTWITFLNFMEELPSHLVFIFITTEPENLPKAVASRCQRYLFPKIKEADIVLRLRKLAAEENMDVESDALDLIALHSDGSVRDAETMLEQLALLGKKITLSLVNDFAGFIPDDRLLDLLELAMSSNTTETVKRARELMDTGVDPLALMSQLAALIMDIIAGTDRIADTKCDGSVFDRQSLTEAELESLRHALRILSEAEKQLRLSSDRSTWFTAALLQIGSNSHTSLAPNKTKHNPKDGGDSGKEHDCLPTEQTTEHKMTSTLNEHSEAPSLPLSKSGNGNASWHGIPLSCDCNTDGFVNDNLLTCGRSLDDASAAGAEDVQTNMSRFVCLDTCELDEIWRKVVERCHSKTLQQLLFTDGKLASIYEENGTLIACIAFKHQDQKDRAERFLKSITNSMEIVLRHNVRVSVGLFSQMADVYFRFPAGIPSASPGKQTGCSDTMVKERKAVLVNENDHCDQQLPDSTMCNLSNPVDSLEDSVDDSCEGSSALEENFHRSSLPVFLVEQNGGPFHRKYVDHEISVDRTDAIVDEQKLESAWLQTAEKGTLGLMGQTKHVKNHLLPQDDVFCHSQAASMMQPVAAMGHPGEDINTKIPSMGIIGNRGWDQSRYGDKSYPLSPSLLHTRSRKYESDTGGYESGPGCSGILCWKTVRSRKEKAKPVNATRSHGSRWCSCIKCCGRSSNA